MGVLVSTLAALRFRFRAPVQVRSALLLTAVTVALTASALAQSDTGRIGGNVVDNTGARIPGATITAVRVESQTKTTATADKRGEYIFPTLQTGHYNVSVEATGFAQVTKEGYEVDDQSAVTVDFTLTAGQTEQVIVTGEVAETVNTQTGEVSHVIDGDTVRDLALNGRNYLDLLGTLPGSVVMNGGDAMATITSGSTTGIVLNGLRATANGLYIDGMQNKDVGGNDRQFNNVGIDFIDHVKAQTSSFSALYGQAAGPAINVVTRSGTNTMHGALFEYIRNNAFDAANYFSRSAIANADGTYNAIHQHLRFNDFGGALGGPILKDKLFYFIGVEWKTIAQNTNPSTVTLPLQSQLAGYFGGYSSTKTPTCTGIHNVPALNLYFNTTDSTRSDYCNISNYITPFGHSLANVFQNVISQATTYKGVDCTLTGCANNNGNTVYELPEPYRNHEYVVRINYDMSKRQNMYGRWVNDTYQVTNPLGDGSLPTTAYHDMGPANNLLLSHTYVVSQSSTNEISAAALWSHSNQEPYGTDWLKSTYGFSYQPLFQVPGYKLGIPLVSVYGYTQFDDDRFLNRTHTTYLQAQDIYTRVMGRMTVKAGVFFGRMRKDQNGKPYYNGEVSFTPASSSANTTGNGLADALLGNFQNYTESSNDTYGFMRLWQAAGFVDDVWRVAPKLSLNLGLRWEWVTPWVSQQNNMAAFYPSLYDPSQAVTVTQAGTVVPGSGNRYDGMRRAGDGVPPSEVSRVPGATSADVLSVPTIGKRGFYNAQRVWMPRFGFAYDLMGNGMTAFRGGVGLYYDIPQGNVAFSALNAPPYLQTISVQNGNMDNLQASAGQSGSNIIGDMYATDPYEQRPYTYQYNFGIQQQLDKAMFLQITYVGNEGRHLLHDPDINGVDPGAEDAAFQVNQSVNINYLRPYKGYGAIYQYRTDADSNYNGLQANLNRRVGKGRFTVAYTWSKALSTSSADTDVAHIFPYSKTYYYGYTTFDRRNIVSATYMLSSPSFARHNMFVRAGLGSWMLTGTGRYQGGQRLTPTGTDTLGVGGRAQYNGMPVTYPHTQIRWWNTVNPGDQVNFQAPAVGAIGNSPVGIILGPDYVDFDLSARKTFNYTERYHLTVQMDAFNLANHPNFGTPTVNVNTQTVYTTTGALATSATTDSASLGILSANRPRNIQGGVRLTF